MAGLTQGNHSYAQVISIVCDNQQKNIQSLLYLVIERNEVTGVSGR